MDENQNKTEQGSPPNDPTPPIQPAEPSTTQSKEMEVHHHGHVHETKKWKEYIFQFLMLFLAVFLGFFAENLRERGVEREREKEYIESLMTDVAGDSLISDGLSTEIFEQIKGIDSLQTILSDLDSWPPREKDSITRQCYKLSKHILQFYPLFFNENTITQLLSSGNMRLIKKEDVSDWIMDYHGYIKFVEVQKQLYVNSVNACIQSMYTIYDISYSRSFMRNDSLLSQLIDSIPNIRLLPSDDAQLKKFISTLEVTKLVASTYKNYLISMTGKASQLHSFLAESYHIKE